MRSPTRREQELSRQAQEANRKEEELQEQQLRERHKFLVDRLLGDIRYFVHALPEFVELPSEAGDSRNSVKQWDARIKSMLDELAELLGAKRSSTDSSKEPPSLESIVTLLNFRDGIMSCMLQGALFRKAALDLEFFQDAPQPNSPPTSHAAPQTPASHAAQQRAVDTAGPYGRDAVMQELQQLARKLKDARGQAVEKYPVKDLPSASADGHFTYDPRKQHADQDRDDPASSQQPNVAQAVSTAALQGTMNMTANSSMMPSSTGAQGGGAQSGAAAAGAGGQAGGAQQGHSTSERSLFQTKLAIVLHEMQSMEKSLRQMKFGKTCRISTSKTIPCEDLRKEIANVFDMCSRLEHELQMSKAQRHFALDVQVESTRKKCDDADREIKRIMQRIVKLEGDTQTLRGESSAIRREKLELAEKYEAIASEHLPVLDKIDKELTKLWESVDQLMADAQMLSQMFRLQVEEYNNIRKRRDERARELAAANATLRRERLKNQLKDVELGKKETLLARTMQAHQDTKTSYTQGKARVQQAEDRMKQKGAEWELAQQELDKRENEIARLKEEMRLATMLVDELEQQKKECMKEFLAATGRPYAMLLEHCKLVSQGEHPPEQS